MINYNPAGERVLVAPLPISQPPHYHDFRQNRDIGRTRRTILILLTIELVREQLPR